MLRTYDRRLRRFEQQVEQRYPGILGRIERRLPTIGRLTPEVRDWCPLPISEVIALGVPPQTASMVTAVAMWRLAGRQVVYIHPRRLPPPIDYVPVEEQKRLPVRALYMATSDADGVPATGMFVWLEYDAFEQRTEIRLQLDHAQPPDLFQTVTQPIHVVRGGLREAVSATMTTSFMRASVAFDIEMPPVGPGTEMDQRLNILTGELAPLMAAVAYLANPNAEVVDAQVVIDDREPQDWFDPKDDGTTTLWLVT
jgi:hypothetical protein